MFLEKIEKTNDIKEIGAENYNALAEEIRQFLIHSISVTGGHLGSNLGAVELTMALHLFLNLPEDKIIWDVGHQSYTHKILTGRRDGFINLRKYGGISGFPKRKESDCDCFEALYNASRLETNFIIILNDNNMSISENVGGVSKYLNNIRTADMYLDLKEGVYDSLHGKSKYGDKMVSRIRRVKSSFKHLVVPGMFFEDMGITYLGPVDGHDIQAMLRILKEAKKVRGAVLVHVNTEKGKGYGPAERHPARFHGAEPFDIETGIPSAPRTKANYTDIFSTVMCKLGQRDEKVVAITAAMPDGTGLKRFRNMYPDRFFDVGIAEEHAVTFAAGLAAGGLKPIVAIYSSFLQRAYDQILHDVCIQNLPVIFAIDRAGLVGSDGETHQGIFDLSYLSSIPNMHIMAPKNKWELSDMIKFALAYGAPMAVRYPRGEAFDGLKENREPIAYGKSESIYREKDIMLLAVGSMVKTALEVRGKLIEKGYSCSLTNARFVKPIDEEAVKEACEDHKLIVTMEENVASGGFGEKVRACVDLLHTGTEVLCVTIPDEYVEHGNVELLKREVGIDADSIVERIVAYKQA